MKTRKEREQELLEMATSKDGDAKIMLECLNSTGDIGSISASRASLIEKILNHEFPESQH